MQHELRFDQYREGKGTVWGYIFLTSLLRVFSWTCWLDLAALQDLNPCLSLFSPGGSKVHEEITVIDPRHPDQLLVLVHGLATRRRERLQLRELGLIRSREKERERWCHTTNSKQAWTKYQLSTLCHRLFTEWLQGQVTATMIDYLKTTHRNAVLKWLSFFYTGGTAPPR